MRSLNPIRLKSAIVFPVAVLALSTLAGPATAGFFDDIGKRIENLPSLPSLPPLPSPTPDSHEPDPRAQSKAFGTSPEKMRSEREMRALFAKGEINGRDLIAELRAIKKAAVEARSERTFQTLMGAIDSSADNLDNLDRFDWKALFETAAAAALDRLRGAISYSALDYFMRTMISDPTALAKHTIELPSPEGLDRAQMQRVLNIAAFVVGAKVADEVAAEGEQTWKNLESEYEELLKRREKTAQLLADVVDVRRKAQAARDEAAVRRSTKELSRYLTKKDIEFIDTFGEDRPLREFANDFSMQNIALEFLRGRNPKAYKEYRAQTDGLIGRTKAYVKTAGGAVAFSGLVASFVNEGAMFLRDREPKKVYRVLPLAREFVQAAGALALRTYKSAETGIAIESSGWNLLGHQFDPEKRFRMLGPNGERTDATASGVFADLKESGEHKRFRAAMFSGGSRGLLHKVYQCDAETTGRMLDGVIPDEMRSAFGEAFMGLPSGSKFFFVNALTNSRLNKHADLVKNVLARDQRKSGRYPAVGDVQRQVAANFGEWTDSQLARMVLANHHGPVHHAQMQVGGTIVRLIPTITAVYEYESYADGCRASALRS